MDLDLRLFYLTPGVIIHRIKWIGSNVRGTEHSVESLGVFHLVRTHLGGEGGFKSPIHFYCVLHANRGGGGPDSM